MKSREDVAVDVEGDRDLAMSEQVRYDLWVDSLLEEQRCDCVAKIVETNPF